MECGTAGKIKVIDNYVDREHAETDAIGILKIIRPTWEEANVNFQVCSYV